MSRPDVVVYAPGLGWGHATHATALLRKLPGEHLVLLPDGVSHPLDAHGIPWRRVRCQDAPAAIRQLRPRLLVVDVFPLGLFGELEGELDTFACPKALVSHVSTTSRPATVPSAYDLVLLIEEVEGVRGLPCGPLLLRDADELLPRDLAREALGAGDEPVILLVRPEAGGEDLDFLVGASGVPTVTSGHYPLLELFNGVDGLVGCPGYNLFAEAGACAVPAAWSWRRRSWDQRARCPAPVRDAGQLAAWAAGVRRRDGFAAEYRNGAGVAASALLELATLPRGRREPGP